MQAFCLEEIFSIREKQSDNCRLFLILCASSPKIPLRTIAYRQKRKYSLCRSMREYIYFYPQNTENSKLFMGIWMWLKTCTLFNKSHKYYQFSFNYLTPWRRGLREKLTRPKLLKKFHTFYEYRRFITVFTTARHKFRGFFDCVVTRLSFYGEELLASRQTPQGGGPPLVGCPRLRIQYIRSYPLYLETVSPSTTWGLTMQWWQEPIYHGRFPLIKVTKLKP
jgi:hypothetical protein